MKYYLFRRQSGQGCDYTIGCGLSLERLSAKTKEEAIEEVIDLPDDWQEIEDEDELHDILCDTGLSDADPAGFRPMSEVTLLEVASETDLLPILRAKLAEVNALKEKRAAQRQEEAERAQYEKLRKKFAK